jgi:hypothetical protein
MKPLRSMNQLAGLALAAGLFAGCSSDGGGGDVSGGMYYGAGFYDPWYHGGYYNDVDVIVTPPGPRPERPVARPLPAARPMPSVPMGARPMPRGR